MVNAKNYEIICTAHAEGSVHDFKLYENSIGYAISYEIKLKADSGYQGILKYHKNSETPKKKPRGGELTQEEKSANKQLARERIHVENINAKVKVFKITAHKYRNRQCRFGLRMALICGIINFENKRLG